MYNFKSDNEWGSYWEFELNKFIEPYFNNILLPQSKFISFTTLRSSDILPKGEWWKFDTLYNVYNFGNIEPIKQVTFEIKTDKYDLSGNICVERSYKGKISGVFHTEADYFIYYMPRYSKDNLYLFKPSKLVEFLSTSRFNSDLMYNGDGGKSLSYVINKKFFDNLVIENNIGKIFTYNVEIPDKFNVKKF